ncbi:MOSC domain-containing protein [[Phormidium] sp. ETS-05]|uniref:MOSC domain-containing protein n=1 Tax=[Phormidium] sp. ETS-05 TaxID=222819 RepID=UPI0018EED3DE|nr:MOSC N-terminal beta barrel domain-containing protein [[Phormidium] sp. ETS-05]
MKISKIFTHPIKGLTPQEQERVWVDGGLGIRGDRAFALMFSDSAHSTTTGQSVPWMSKKNFAVQNDWPALAALKCHYEAETGRLTVENGDPQSLLVADTTTEAGRERIGAFFTGYLAASRPTEKARHPQVTPVRLVGENVPGRSQYLDRQQGHISLIGASTLEDIAAKCGVRVDPRRFRPNMVLEGVPPWGEFDWVGQRFHLGDCEFTVTAPIGRCLNIEVNPDSGIRDIPLFSLLLENFGHAQTGVVAEVSSSGVVAVGDCLTPVIA